jgi:DNA-binding GntR family transcriptional regulator
MPLRAPRRGESSYRLLTQSLREQIFRGEFDEVSPLPTELALAEEHHLSRQTVRRAFQELVAEGLVYRVQGRGTFLTPSETRYRRPFGTVDDLLNLQVDTAFELIKPLSPAIDPGAAATLRLDQPQVHHLTFLRRHHGEAFCLTRVYLPPRVARSLAGCRELTDPGMHTTSTVIGLIESHGNDIAEAEQVITATAADQNILDHLGCTIGAPILHIERTYLDRGGAGLEHAVSDFLPQYYSHRSRLGRSLAPDPSPVLLQE